MGAPKKGEKIKTSGSHICTDKNLARSISPFFPGWLMPLAKEGKRQGEEERKKKPSECERPIA